MRFLRRLTGAVTEVDAATISLTAALRCGVLELVLLLGAVATDRLGELVPAAVGLLFVCMCDPHGSEAQRDRAMAWLAVWASVVMLFAGSVSESLVPHLLVGFAIALVTGYVGVLGAVGQLNGTLVLVVFSIFAGTPAPRDTTVRDAIAIGVAAAIGGLVIAAPRILHRARGPRAAFARIVRGLGHVVVTDPLSMGAAAHVVREREFAEITAAEDLSGPAREWFGHLGAAAHLGRLSMLGLSAQVARMPDQARDEARERAVAFLDAVRHAWRAAGTAVVWPVRRPALTRARRAVGPAHDAFVAVADPIGDEVAADLLHALDTVVGLLEAAWPVGRSAASGPSHAQPGARQRLTTAFHTLHAHLSPADPFLRHGIRLAVAFTVATALAEQLNLPHSYWLPMTVAWVSKPAMGDTTERVTARMSGTVIGVAISAAVIGPTHPRPWTRGLTQGFGSSSTQTPTSARWGQGGPGPALEEPTEGVLRHVVVAEVTTRSGTAVVAAVACDAQIETPHWNGGVPTDVGKTTPPEKATSWGLPIRRPSTPSCPNRPTRTRQSRPLGTGSTTGLAAMVAGVGFEPTTFGL